MTDCILTLIFGSGVLLLMFAFSFIGKKTNPSISEKVGRGLERELNKDVMNPMSAFDVFINTPNASISKNAHSAVTEVGSQTKIKTFCVEIEDYHYSFVRKETKWKFKKAISIFKNK